MAKKTIKIKNYSDVNEEIVAAGTITPGMLLELTSAGTVQAHSVASGNALPMFACEDELVGKTITDNYSELDQVSVWVPGRGDVVYGILAQGENVTIGTYLVSKGNGHLKAVADSSSFGDDDSAKIIGQAIEAVNATAAAANIMVRII